MKIKNIPGSVLTSRTGIDHQTLRNYQYWNLVPDIFLACKISEILGVSVEYLASGKDYALKNAVRRRQFIIQNPDKSITYKAYTAA